MRASAHVGRVGGLAVALGIGAAVVAGGAGSAWATPADTSDSRAGADSAAQSDAPRPVRTRGGRSAGLTAPAVNVARGGAVASGEQLTHSNARLSPPPGPCPRPGPSPHGNAPRSIWPGCLPPSLRRNQTPDSPTRLLRASRNRFRISPKPPRLRWSQPRRTPWWIRGRLPYWDRDPEFRWSRRCPGWCWRQHAAISASRKPLWLRSLR